MHSHLQDEDNSGKENTECQPKLRAAERCLDSRIENHLSDDEFAHDHKPCEHDSVAFPRKSSQRIYSALQPNQDLLTRANQTHRSTRQQRK